jgi:hypothetical protein
MFSSLLGLILFRVVSFDSRKSNTCLHADNPLGSATQIYYFATLLLTVHQPAVGGLRELQRTERRMNEAIDSIGGIATTTTEGSAVIVSTQCLYAAGLHARDAHKRDQILDILHSHQAQTGWPANDLGEDLRIEWNVSDTP